jgi:hypothetical protein
MTHTSRSTFGALFQSVYKTGVIAEIGVQNGFNSKQLFESGWKGKIICVDNWIRQEELGIAKELLKDYSAYFMQCDSADAAQYFISENLDGVYIDAGHSYPEVKRDFEAWYPKVRKGGIVSGHDYGVNDCIGVKEFIDEYMRLHPEVEMNFTTDDFFEGIEYQSWWFVKG